MDIQIKSLTIEHIHDVQRLSEQLGYALPISEIEINIKEVTSAKNNCAFVAIADQKIIGWIHGFKTVVLESRPYIEIGGLIVDEAHRGKGAGKKLMDRLKEWCLENNIHDIRVRSNIKRKKAHKFYVNNGFAGIKEQKVFQMKL